MQEFGGGGRTGRAIPVAGLRLRSSCERQEWQLSEPRGRKSWSEQNKERVWAAVTSCLTNVPPTLIRAMAVAATPSLASGQSKALGSVGRFPSNSGPEALPAICTSSAHLPPTRGQGRTTPPRAPPAWPPLHPRRVHPRARRQPGLWTVGRLSRTPGPIERGHEAPARRDPGSVPPRNLPSCARPGALHS